MEDMEEKGLLLAAGPTLNGPDTSYKITVIKVESLAGICNVTYRSNLQPQILSRLIPANYDHDSTHKSLRKAADEFYVVRNNVNSNQNPFVGGPTHA